MVKVSKVRRSISWHHVVGSAGLGYNFDHHEDAVGAIFVDSSILANNNFNVASGIFRFRQDHFCSAAGVGQGTAE